MTQSEKLFLRKLGLHLRKLREQKGWTLEEAEDHGWPSWRHLQQIETGKKNITVLTLKRLADLYTCDLRALISL